MGHSLLGNTDSDMKWHTGHWERLFRHGDKIGSPTSEDEANI